MQIGAVAKKIGLSVDAIRFYERNALLLGLCTQAHTAAIRPREVVND
jgi:hypothetical protein